MAINTKSPMFTSAENFISTMSHGITLGWLGSSVAIYTDGSGWATAESMKVARFAHAAVRLSDGKILVAGGSDATGAALASAEIYDPATGHWTLTGSMSQPTRSAS